MGGSRLLYVLSMGRDMSDVPRLPVLGHVDPHGVRSSLDRGVHMHRDV